MIQESELLGFRENLFWSTRKELMADAFEQLVNNGRGGRSQPRSVWRALERQEVHRPGNYSTCCRFKAIRTPFTNTTLWFIRSWLVMAKSTNW